MNDPLSVRTPTSAPGMPTFLVIWAGQLVSTFGSGLTAFALGVWVYGRAGDVTSFALMGLFAALPGTLLSPVAGALVDRWDRRRAMILSDGGAAFATLFLVALLLTDRLTLPVVYVALAFSSLCTTFQWPAYAAATTLLVEKEDYGRASGLQQVSQGASQLLAPLAAGALMAAIHAGGVLLLDVVTYGLALATLVAVRVPRPPAGPAEAAKAGLKREIEAGWRFIVERPGLLRLLGYLAVINLLAGFHLALTTPLVLSIASAADLGVVLSLASAGLLVGSLVMSIHGGPRHRMSSVLGFGLLYAVGFLVVGVASSVWGIATGSFVLMFAVPLINGSSQAIWQSKVPPALQGRVFSVRRMIAQSTLPLAFLVAGPLADRVFTPLFGEGGAGRSLLPAVLGVGEGRGISALFLALGSLAVVAGIVAVSSRPLRRCEATLADWDAE